MNIEGPKENKLMPEAQETTANLDKKREVYAQTIENEGLIGRISRAIRGGKMSADGMLLMAIDAQTEDKLRNREKKEAGGRWEDMQKKLREKYQESYLRLERKSSRHPDGILQKFTKTLSGEINGHKVKVRWALDEAYKGDTPPTFEGTIEGKKITGDEAKRIWDDYETVAILQDATSKEAASRG